MADAARTPPLARRVLLIGVTVKRGQKWAAGVGAFIVLGAGFTAFILPGIVRSKAVEGIETATGRKAAISRIAPSRSALS